MPEHTPPAAKNTREARAARRPLLRELTHSTTELESLDALNKVCEADPRQKPASATTAQAEGTDSHDSRTA